MPRKPRQQRARETMEAIVEAGFICVGEMGQAHTTTHHIAAKAGVGVGSVYEYFKNKEAIYEAMNQKFVADLVETINRFTPRIMDLKYEDALDLIFDQTRELLDKNDGRYLKMARMALLSEADQYMEKPALALQQMLIQYLMAHPEFARLPDLRVMTHVFIYGGMFVLLRGLAQENPDIGYEQLKDALTKLVVSYFRQQW